ncbi:MAG: type VI secretion system baseplate subunit TssE [Epsilonproteobacteria bacterium]|nr:MAG: type VI secretion system baseplate subunit TssE [Campylobacterota bacterium]
MFRERLLERVAHMDVDSSYRPDVLSADVELQSILKYIQNILSTKQGSAIISYDFGIPDVTNFHDKSYGQYIKDMENSLIGTIIKFEPRLENVKVIYDEQAEKTTMMHFKIQAQLKNYKDIDVIFETVINPDGKVTINE